MIRRLQGIIIAGVLVIAAFSTGEAFLFYLLYLGILVLGGSYVAVRLGLTDLEAGYAVSQLSGHVGDQMRITYTLRNGSRIPKPWLEVHNPTTLPGSLPGRAISLGGRSERSWLVRAPLTRRGHFRIEPLHIRTGDPFGFFEASATVGQGVSVIVYPKLEPLPAWRLPAASLEGSHSSAERTLQTTPLVTTVRPYAPGDSMNRIHWRMTARHVDAVHAVARGIRPDGRDERRRLERPSGRGVAALQAGGRQPPGGQGLELRVDDDRDALADRRRRLEEPERIAGPDVERFDAEVAAAGQRRAHEPRPFAPAAEADRPAGQGPRQRRRVVDLQPGLRDPAAVAQRVGDPHLVADMAAQLADGIAGLEIRQSEADRHVRPTQDEDPEIEQVEEERPRRSRTRR